MTVTLNASFLVEKNKMEGSAPVRLLHINFGSSAASNLYWAAYADDIEYFQPKTATAQTYTAAPIKIGNMRYSNVDQAPTLDVEVSNIDRTMTAYLEANEGLRGQKFTIIRTYTNLLSNASANLIEEFYVDGAQSTLNSAKFSLVPKTTLYRVTVPKRYFMRDQCQWKFLGTECAGAATVATPFVNATLASSLITTCMKTLASCDAYNNTSRYGGWPGIPKDRSIRI